MYVLFGLLLGREEVRFYSFRGDKLRFVFGEFIFYMIGKVLYILLNVYIVFKSLLKVV